MPKTMRLLSIGLVSAMAGALLFGVVPSANAQRRHRVVVVEPFLWGPFYPYGYYPYPSAYMAANYGEVKIDTHDKNADVYIDGGFAAKIKDTKKFALRPGNHDIQLRSPDGQNLFEEQVAVTIGHTTKLHVS